MLLLLMETMFSAMSGYSRRYRVLVLCSIALLALAPSASEAKPPLEVAQLIAQKRARGEAAGEIHLAVAAAYLHLGQQEPTFEHLRAARKRGIAQSRVDLVAGTLYRKVGRYDAACATLLRVLVDHPGQPHALVELWKSLYEAELRRFPLAVDRKGLRRRLADHGLYLPEEFTAQSTNSANSRKLTVRGHQALLAQRYTTAAGLFRGAIELLPSNSGAHRGLALAYLRQKDYRRAAGAYSLYLELNPNAPDADEIDQALVAHWKTLAP